MRDKRTPTDVCGEASIDGVMNTAIDMNRDINKLFFFLWGRIASSVFGYRYRLDRLASHQHCFHLIVPYQLKTF